MNRNALPYPSLIFFFLLSVFASCSNINKSGALDPKAAEIEANFYYYNGLASHIKGDYDQTVICYTKALEIYPQHPRACNSMAWLLATCPKNEYRDGAKAVELAQNAVTFSREVDFLDTLAASFAEAGKFKDAMVTQERAINALKDESKTQKLAEYKAHLICYQLHRPWRKTHCIDDFITTEIDIKSIPPEQQDEEKNTGVNQVADSTPKESEIVKIESGIPQETNQTHVQSSHQDIRPVPEQVQAEKAEVINLEQMRGKSASGLKPVVLRENTAQKTDTNNSQQIVEESRAETHTKYYPYTVHVSSFRSKEKSNDLAFKLVNQEEHVFTCPTHIAGNGNWHRIFIGYYETLEETRNAALKLKGKQDIFPLAAKMPYAVQVGTFDSENELLAFKTDLKSKAYLAYTIPRDQNSNVRLLMGAYRTKNDASVLAQELRKDGFNPEIVLR